MYDLIKLIKRQPPSPLFFISSISNCFALFVGVGLFTAPLELARLVFERIEKVLF